MTERWVKSSRSEGAGNCVEVAHLPDAVGVRDSKDPAGPNLTFGLPAWRGFVADVKAGEFDTQR